MNTAELLRDDAGLWHAATPHPSLDQVRTGSPGRGASSRGLARDYHFAKGLSITGQEQASDARDISWVPSQH